jgi:hypothetical protein
MTPWAPLTGRSGPNPQLAGESGPLFTAQPSGEREQPWGFSGILISGACSGEAGVADGGRDCADTIVSNCQYLWIS